MNKFGLGYYFDKISSKDHLKFLKFLDAGEFDNAKAMISNGFDINSNFKLKNSNSTEVVTLFDIVCTNEVLFDFLVFNGYQISDTYDNSLLMMARCCKPKLFKKRLKYLQKISSQDAQYLHYMVCCYGSHIENIDLLNKKGITISQFGGCSLSHLISFKNDKFFHKLNIGMSSIDKNKLIKKLIKGGADVNYNKYNTVLASTATPLINAVIAGDVSLVKFLIKYGADVTLCDEYGVRPIDIAMRQGNIELVKILNKFESFEYKSAKEEEKKQFNIPDELVEFLKTDEQNRCISFSNDSVVKKIKFYSYNEIVWFNYKKTKVIDLVSFVDGYSTPMFVLNLKNNKVYGFDNEHDNFTLLTDWSKFYKKMEYYVDGYIRGKFDK